MGWITKHFAITSKHFFRSPVRKGLCKILIELGVLVPQFSLMIVVPQFMEENMKEDKGFGLAFGEADINCVSFRGGSIVSDTKVR